MVFWVLILDGWFLALFIDLFEELFTYFDDYINVGIRFLYIIVGYINFSFGCVQLVVFCLEILNLLFLFIFVCKCFLVEFSLGDFSLQNVLAFVDVIMSQNDILNVKVLVEKEQVIETFDGFSENQIHDAIGKESVCFIHLINDFIDVFIILKVLEFVDIPREIFVECRHPQFLVRCVRLVK